VDSDRFEKRMRELEYFTYTYIESDVQMARRFGTTQSTISRINSGQCRSRG
jgi:hypothetical protein